MRDFILVAGGGGFIGGHLVGRLLSLGFAVKCVDIKPLSEWHAIHKDASNFTMDLREKENCETACQGVAKVYNLACDMGGMGFIEANRAKCMLSVLINTHLLQAALKSGVKRFFFASSACVYNSSFQATNEDVSLNETMAYPADPEDGYGWEKLFSERMCRHFTEDFGLETRIARFHNVYGPQGTWQGGREKAPAAICRKVIEAKSKNLKKIEVWGDGEQTRSFLYISDAIDGMLNLMDSNVDTPINIGSDELVSINQLVSLSEKIANISLDRVHNLDAPKGVRGRCSDNTLCKKLLDWEPKVSLESGLALTFDWIQTQYKKANTRPERQQEIEAAI